MSSRYNWLDSACGYITPMCQLFRGYWAEKIPANDKPGYRWAIYWVTTA